MEFIHYCSYMGAANTTKGEGSRLGRPRNPNVTPKVLDATLKILTERGFNQLRIDDVAAESGVAKTTIYRRWPSLNYLVLDAVDAALGERGIDGTDDPIADLMLLVRMVYDAIVDNPVGRSIPVISIDLARNPLMAEEFRQRITDPVRNAAIGFIELAIEQKRISKINAPLAVDMMIGAIIYRLGIVGELITLEECYNTLQIVLQLESLPAETQIILTEQEFSLKTANEILKTKVQLPD